MHQRLLAPFGGLLGPWRGPLVLEFLLSVDRVQPHRVVHVVHVQDLDPIKYKINETVKN